VDTPRISVVVRSYNRLPALAELLAALLEQEHDSFEIVVVEQSTVRDGEDRIAALAADPRVRVERRPPLGGPRARNEGVRLARGALLVFIDDDDLPSGRDWLRKHEASLGDPKCLGVTGRFIVDGAAPYRDMAKARARVLSFSWLKWQRVYVRSDERKHVESLMGGNVAIPRTTLERFGLWDECTPIEDEPSLAFRIAAGRQADEYLLFEPATPMIRRLDVPGGMAKRTLSGPAYARRVFTYLHNIVGHYFPWRFRLLYPAYVGLVAWHVTEWIVSDSKRHRTWWQRALGSLGFNLSLPLCWLGWLGALVVDRVRHGSPPHRPTI
jgi:glycosyltransferase involved in cell wall biosynthesis